MLNYPTNFEEKIHFDKVKTLLKNFTLSSMGETLVDDIKFTTQTAILDKQLGTTADMKAFFDEGLDFPVAYYIDLRPHLQNIKIEGTFLDLQELFNLKRSIETIASIVTFIKNQEEGKADYLKELIGSNRHTFPYLKDRLNQILDKNGRIKDNASTELKSIRNQLIQKQQSVSRIVDRLMKNAKTQGWAESDTEPSIRDGRLVIPIPSAFKRKISGIVHDESATGKTSYIEPAEVVEVNNEIRELTYAERREILRILTDFTNELRPYLEELFYAYDFLAEIDFIRAKAMFAIQIEAVRPNIVQKPFVEWIQARHPILYINFKKDKKDLVPLHIKLHEDQRILLISGPNAGGKSVCLKTVGLLQYMLQCGLFVPVNEGSKFGLFDKIFIDIGDEQSIEDDLSTYSSHLSNMKYFTKNANEKTLILIDEFGAGTEPLLGGAIAEAVLSQLNEKQIYGVITTHYTNLKHFASESEGIVNCAMLYDTHAMTPLYQLEIGTPGSSFAFEIARKIGLSETILQEAQEKIGEDRVNFDAHLRSVVKDKMVWQKKRFKIAQQEKNLQRILDKYTTELEEVKQLRKKEVTKAKEEASSILAEANKTIEKTIKTIKENKANKSVTRTIREKFEKDKERLLEEENQTAIIDKKIEQIKERERRKQKQKQEQKENKTPNKNILSPTVGALVKIKKTGTTAEVIAISNGKAAIAIGALKSHIALSALEVISNNQAKKTKTPHTHSDIQRKVFNKRMSFNPDIDVRGMRGTEAVQKVADHLDNALMLGINEVRILHGTGSGILRKMIREYIANQHDVENFRDEHIENGGSGITIITL